MAPPPTPSTSTTSAPSWRVTPRRPSCLPFWRSPRAPAPAARNLPPHSWRVRDGGDGRATDIEVALRSGFPRDGDRAAFGATAAVAHILGLDERGWAHAFGIAGSHAAGLKSCSARCRGGGTTSFPQSRDPRPPRLPEVKEWWWAFDWASSGQRTLVYEAVTRTHDRRNPILDTLYQHGLGKALESSRAFRARERRCFIKASQCRCERCTDQEALRVLS